MNTKTIGKLRKSRGRENICKKKYIVFVDVYSVLCYYCLDFRFVLSRDKSLCVNLRETHPVNASGGSSPTMNSIALSTRRFTFSKRQVVNRTRYYCRTPTRFVLRSYGRRLKHIRKIIFVCKILRSSDVEIVFNLLLD